MATAISPSLLHLVSPLFFSSVCPSSSLSRTLPLLISICQCVSICLLSLCLPVSLSIPFDLCLHLRLTYTGRVAVEPHGHMGAP